MSRRFNRWSFVLLALLGLGVGLLLYQPARYFPSTWRLRKDAFSSSSWILDRKGRLLYEIIDPHKGAHRPVSLEEVPIVLQWAVIATEDASFYRNPGLDVLAMLRALWMNLREGRIVSGGSTITQQLVRNVLLSPEERTEKSLWRKAKEILGAFALTKSMSKEEILELYLNETYFGNMAYGVDAAARAYFAKPVSQLDLAESALLAGLPQSPAAYNPLTHFAKAKARQKVVLELMVKAGYISPEEAEMAYREPLHLASAPFKIEAPHFCMMVREQAAQLLGEGALRRGGLRIYTTLDLDLQHAAEAHVRRHLRMLNEPRPSEPGHNVHNAAVVVLDVHNGAVRALVGSPDYFDERIDGAVNAALALRQPGSAIKPLTYAAAFERGYSPATVFADVRSLFLTREGRPYVPVNYDYQYHGPVSLRQALACSYNVVAVKLLDRIGLDALLAMARRLGITTLSHSEKYGLALTLGGGEVQLLQLTAAYAAFANSGWRVAPYCIERIEDAEGRVLYQHAPVRQRALDPRIAYLITDILADREARFPAFGEGNMLELPFPAAAKTGTTTDWRDNWTVGYSSELAVGVWVGNADNSPMERVSGISGAAPIWNAVMRSAHPVPPAGFAQPPGLVRATVCVESGLLPNEACPHRREELFLHENLPRARCTMHRFLSFDGRTGELATKECPPEWRVLRRVTIWPPELLPWAEERGLALPEGFGQQAVEGNTSTGEQAPSEERGLRLLAPDSHSSFAISREVPWELQKLEVVAFCDPALRVRRLVLLVDGIQEHVWLAPPYRYFWQLAPGEHLFSLQAINERGNSIVSAPVRIVVYPSEDSERR